jgi:alkylhydroperoxidase family enzyme
MARFGMVPLDTDDPILSRIFSNVRGHGIEVPNLYRTLALSPTMLRAWVDFAWTLRLQSRTSRALREIMILRSAQVSQTDYEWVHHVPMARQAGLSQEKIDAVADWRDSSLFDEPERAALEVSEQITRGPGASAEAMQRLSTFFSPLEVIELVLTLSLYACVSRIIDTMGVEIEDDFRHLVPRCA